MLLSIFEFSPICPLGAIQPQTRMNTCFFVVSKNFPEQHIFKEP